LKRSAENKTALQKRFGLLEDPDAPVFFWPSRLDPVQKGCQLLADILYHVVSKYWLERLQMVFVSGGVFKQHFEAIVSHHGLGRRVAVHDFNESLSRKAYAASDFILMPSSFEPCGLTQMIAPRYGSLPVAHDTGGIHDTVEHLNIEQNTGNGFLFEVFDANGLFWAIDQAMAFYRLAPEIKNPLIARIMAESAERFNHEVAARQYIDLYEKMLERPLISTY